MIRELRIRNLAIIESLYLEFAPELTILSGEQGEGMSSILGTLRRVVGGGASSSVVTGNRSSPYRKYPA